MIEEKLSKINKTIPKVNKSSDERDSIYNEVKNSENNKYNKTSFKINKLIPIVFSLVILGVTGLVISILNNENSNLSNNKDNSDDILKNNPYCEEIEYEEWMDEIKVYGSDGEADMPEPSTTLSAYFSGFCGVYDVNYSNGLGYYLVVYVDSTKVKTISSMYGCEGLYIGIKDLTVLNGTIRLNYKKNLDNLLFVKCNNESKIPSKIGKYYPVQVFYVSNILIKEEIFSSTIINKEKYFAASKSYIRTDNEYLEPNKIPDGTKNIEEVLRGQSAIIISNDLETILNKKIISLQSWCYNNQLFYNDHIVFDPVSLGLNYFYDIEYDFLLDENSTLRTNVSNSLRNILTQVKTNLGKITNSEFIYYYKSDIMHYYYDISNYSNDKNLTYLKIEDYKTILREVGKTVSVEYNVNKVINNNPTYVASAYQYLYKIISNYEDYLEAAQFLDINKDIYDEEFFINNNIIILYDKQDFDVKRSESIIRITEYGNDEPFDYYAHFLILEFDKNNLSIDDYIKTLYEEKN